MFGITLPNKGFQKQLRNLIIKLINFIKNVNEIKNFLIAKFIYYLVNTNNN